MKPYVHKIRYYETDKMGVTHHSNYLRFMEEARMDFLEQIGFGYKRMEAEGVISPVVSVDIKYKKPTAFDDELEIEVEVEEVSAARLSIGYAMSCNGEIVCTASSTHCFVDEKGHPISLKRMQPKLFELLSSYKNA